jgi:tetratricopeptide (TPR) repeat protein
MKGAPRVLCAVAGILLFACSSHAWGLSAESRERYARGARLASQQARYRDALEDFRYVLNEDPTHAPAVVSAAQCRAALGELQPARDLYEQALSLSLAPESVVTVRRELGKIGLRQGRYTDAQTHLEEARRLARGAADIATLLGDVYQKRGSPARAADEYRRALALDGDARAAHMGLASTLLADSAEAALSHAQAAIQLDPFDPDVWYVAARALTKAGRTEDARSALESHTRTKAYALDIDAIQDALRRDPRNTALLQSLADRHEEEGALRHAIGAYRRATGHPTTRQLAYVNIAMLHLRLGEMDAAGAALREASESGETSAGVHAAYGELWSARRDWAQASTAYRAAVGVDAKMPHAWVGLMRAAAMVGGRGPAEAVLAEWLRADPESAPARNERGLLHYRDGDHGSAIQALERVIATDPAYHEAANNLAWIYAETDRSLDRARALIAGVIQDAPTPGAYDTLAYVEQQAGNWQAAVRAAARAVAMDPGNDDYRKRRDEIQRAISE